MHSHNNDLRNIIALFSLSNPDLIESMKHKVAESEFVAANLITSIHSNDASAYIKAVVDQHYQFNLDLKSRIYQSKGDWVWVKQVDIYFPQKTLLSLSIKPRVIDLPYTNNRLCAHWLFRNISNELHSAISSYL